MRSFQISAVLLLLTFASGCSKQAPEAQWWTSMTSPGKEVIQVLKLNAHEKKPLMISLDGRVRLGVLVREAEEMKTSLKQDRDESGGVFLTQVAAGIRSVMVVVAVRRLFSEHLAYHGAGSAVPSFLLLGGIPTGGFDCLDRSDSLPERKKSKLGFEAEADFDADIRSRGHSHHSLAWTLRDYLVRYRTMKKADPAGTDNSGASPRRV